MSYTQLASCTKVAKAKIDHSAELEDCISNVSEQTAQLNRLQW
jgi:hypothetical protein